MKNYTVRPYQSGDYEIWNAFLDTAKNATFLFHRNFMEYHSDRFEDYSLLVFDGEKPVALLPANRKEAIAYSHQGLTYGGLVYGESLKPDGVITIFRSVLEFLHTNGVTRLHIKTVPSIYHLKPAQEIEYALFLSEATLVRRDALSVVDMAQRLNFSDSRKEGIKKGIASRLEIREENDLVDFWNKILIPNLQKRHGTQPVHTLSEITGLKADFPNQIRQFNVYQDNKIIAGSTIFESARVAHAQYISANEAKTETGSLDFLHDYLLNHIFKHKSFFDFGISNEANGKILNKGLAFWKSGFGSGIVTQDFYEVETQNHTKLANVFK